MAVGVLSVVALFSMGIGVLAMLACAAFMFSSKQVDVMGAGLGIVGGAILFGSGLICLAILATRSNSPDDRSHINH